MPVRGGRTPPRFVPSVRARTPATLPGSSAERIHEPMQRAPQHPPRTAASIRRMLAAFAFAALAASPAHAQSSPRIFDGSLLPSFGNLRSVLSKHLIVPVQGVNPDRLRDSYLEGRSGGRTHHAIDIHAPLNTPVIAVTDGTILKLHRGGIGGNTIYHLDDDGRTRYYYAHLDHYADGLSEGMHVSRGQVIGYVGDTGNAQPGDYHLHFAVALLSNLHRWWDGQTLDPFYLLRDGVARVDGASPGGETAGDAASPRPVRLPSVAVERPRRERAAPEANRTLNAAERRATGERLEREERAALHRCAEETGRARARCRESVGDRFTAARALLARHVDPRVCTAAEPEHATRARRSGTRHAVKPKASAAHSAPCAPARKDEPSARRGRDSDDSRGDRASARRRSGEGSSSRGRSEERSTSRARSTERSSSRRASEERSSTRTKKRGESERSHRSTARSTTHRAEPSRSESRGSTSKHRAGSSASRSGSSTRGTHSTRPSESGRSRTTANRSTQSREHASTSSHKKPHAELTGHASTTRRHERSE
ncbi:MAG: endopeptidase [Gemmatimonadetes bacterium]|nr:endopeptidase [Gemmatimonadota bacterium]